MSEKKKENITTLHPTQSILQLYKRNIIHIRFLAHWIWTCMGSNASLPDMGSINPEAFPRKVTLAPVSACMWFKKEP